MTSSRRKRLCDIIVAKGLVTQEQINEILLRPDGREKRIGERLLDEGLITEVVLAQALAEQRDLRYADLTDYRVTPKFFETIPVELMQRYQFIPMEDADETLTVAMSDPNNIPAIDELEMILNRQIEIRVSTPSAIQAVLKISGSSEQVMHAVSEDFKFHIVKEQENGEGEEVLSIESIDKDESPIIRLMHTTIFDAIQRRASDIHIESTDKNVLIKYRIDGVLYPATEPIDIKFHSAMVSRIKVMSDLDIAERRVPQDGRFKLRTGGKTIDFRVSILPSAFGEDMCIRILDKESITAGVNTLRLESLGFDENDLRRFRKSIREPYGMVLVTGPTGSGKTTTLYAALTEINTGEDKFITIEDPVEYQLRGVVQIPVNEKKGLTFARGLRSILRHDPDKIMVGEIRDAETAQIAVQSALTGHLVFTTVHANNAFDVLGRFLNMGIEAYNFVSSLNCILAQRLVRILCPRCKKPVRLSRKELDESALDYEKYKDRNFYDAGGCKECNYTGFRGRKAITEFLDLSDHVREMILDKRPPSEIRKAALAEGMTTLRQSAITKILAGDTTLKEINRVTFIE
ncbi:MAG: Flp pilus assembly complex ATPase component TadA [Nitrospirae bacterium]|nr:Flp pilus assembly complex ATPase component TadA [Nitrospirota bacterium]